jgi:hypothetical protein
MNPQNKMVGAVILLGVVMMMAAAVVMKSPRWNQKAKEQRRESVLQGMTPDKAITLCGKPMLDETQTSQATLTRRLIFRNDYALAVELNFTAPAPEPQTWHLSGIQDPSGEIKYETPASQIGVLPCLDGKQAKKPDQKPDQKQQ